RQLIDSHSIPTRRSSDLEKKPQYIYTKEQEIPVFYFGESTFPTVKLNEHIQKIVNKSKEFWREDIKHPEVLIFNFETKNKVQIGDRKSTRLNSSHVKISY